MPAPSTPDVLRWLSWFVEKTRFKAYIPSFIGEYSNFPITFHQRLTFWPNAPTHLFDMIIASRQAC